LAVGLVFTFERVWTVRKGGRAAILLALPVFLEIAFDIFLQLVFIKVLIDAALVKKSSWGHVKHPISDRAKDS
jgi:hypothetical protein